MKPLFPDEPLFLDVNQAIQQYEEKHKEIDKRDDHGTRLQVYHETEDRLVSPMFYHIVTVASKACEIPKRG